MWSINKVCACRTLVRPSGMRSIKFFSARCASSRSFLCNRNEVSYYTKKPAPRNNLRIQIVPEDELLPVVPLLFAFSLQRKPHQRKPLLTKVLRLTAITGGTRQNLSDSHSISVQPCHSKAIFHLFFLLLSQPFYEKFSVKFQGMYSLFPCVFVL